MDVNMSTFNLKCIMCVGEMHTIHKETDSAVDLTV